MEDKQVVKAMAALAQANRLKMFRALVVAGQNGLVPGSIAEAFVRPMSRRQAVIR